jgi:5-methylcytosine-specific restriction endonuclease McrA
VSDSPWQDKENLQELYIEQGLSSAAIGEKLGCSDVTVLDWLDRHDIPVRDTDPPTMTGDDHPRSVSREEIIEDYRELADELNKTPSQEEYNDHGEYTWSAIRGHFDGMGELQDTAGLERHRNGRVTLECEFCGEEYSEKHAKKDSSRFCSRECDGKWKSEAYAGEGNPNEYKQIEFTCEWCGKTDTGPPHKENRFCSQSCMIEWRSREFSGEGHPRYKGGKDVDRGPSWERRKRKARERDNHQCQQCGADRDEASQLHVHHIIPFERFGIENHREANRLRNLITLCASCHSKTEWGNIAIQSRLSNFTNETHPNEYSN